MTGTLLSGPSFRGVVAAPGRIIRAYSGGMQTWSGSDGRPRSPPATAISFTATGIMAEGDDYSCISSNNALLVDTQLDDAIAPRVALDQTQQHPVTVRRSAARDHHQRRAAGRDGFARAAVVGQPGRRFLLVHLAHHTDLQPDRDHVTAAAGLSTGCSPTSQRSTSTRPVSSLRQGGRKAPTYVTGLDVSEKVLDLTGNGNYGAGSPPAGVTAAKQAELALNGVRAAWTGSWPAPRGLLRTMGGAPVEPAMVQAGQMTQVQLQDAGQWGETASTANHVRHRADRPTTWTRTPSH
jgi:hypothetical protein